MFAAPGLVPRLSVWPPNSTGDGPVAVISGSWASALSGGWEGEKGLGVLDKGARSAGDAGEGVGTSEDWRGAGREEVTGGFSARNSGTKTVGGNSSLRKAQVWAVGGGGEGRN